jgi:DNA-binding NtrC family response regulator
MANSPVIEEVLNILIVDDDRMLCETLRDIFAKEESLKITSSYNGVDAIQKIKERQFDLVLTDLRMPGADGIEVLKIAKEINQEAHVVIMTGFASLETAMEAIKKGAYDYITKPFKLDEIKIAVQNACEKIRLLRQNRTLIANLNHVYQELDNLKKSRNVPEMRMPAISKKMDEIRDRVAEDIIGLQTLPTGLPAVHYLQKRRTDKRYVLVELEKLGKLREEGIITEEEFLSCKTKFLNEI